MLHVPPWTLLGFTYERTEDMPICWREWAYDFSNAKAAAQQAQMGLMLRN